MIWPFLSSSSFSLSVPLSFFLLLSSFSTLNNECTKEADEKKEEEEEEKNCNLIRFFCVSMYDYVTLQKIVSAPCSRPVFQALQIVSIDVKTYMNYAV